MGDLNGWTKLGDDFVSDNNDKHSPINDSTCYTKDTHLDRQNQDTHAIDQQGRKILQLCKSLGVRILNGRTPGDLPGRMTRYPTRPNETPSVIDYALCSLSIMEDIKYFNVLHFTGISDHCCISLNIKCNVTRPMNKPIYDDSTENAHMHPIKEIFTFDPRKEKIFIENMGRDGNTEKLSHSLNHTENNREQIENSIEILNDILLNAAKKVLDVQKS